ncbi:MAG: HD domain-containing protein [Candidatus Woesearchaeota archaeon]|nr:HD domain-containing protein [Candidatus Woesearchaeota archaeon]
MLYQFNNGGFWLKRQKGEPKEEGNMSDAVETLKGDIRESFLKIDRVIDLSSFLGMKSLDYVIDSYFNDLNNNNENIRKICKFHDLKKHDEESYNHSLRVGILAWAALKGVEDYRTLNNKDISEFCIGAIVHDIGKLAVDDKILKRKGKLSENELKKIKRHVNKGHLVDEYILKEGINTALMKMIVEGHHKYQNGNGYGKIINENKFNGLIQLVSIADHIDAAIFRGIYQEKCRPSEIENYLELVSANEDDNLEYLKNRVNAIKDSEGKPYFKDVEPGKFERKYALPYIYMLRNHAR